MRMKMRTINKRGLLSFLLTLIMIIGVLPLSAPTVSAEDDTVEVSTWEELKRALEYTTNCSVVRVIADIETKDLNGHTGLHQDNIIFMTMAMDKVLDLNGHTVNAYVKYYSEVGQGYLINVSHKNARLTIRDSVGGGALIGEFNQEFYFQFINVSGGTLVMESGTVKMLCPSRDDRYTKCAVSVSGTAIFNGGEVQTQVTSPNGEPEDLIFSRRLQAIRGEKGGSVTINGGTFDRVVLHSSPTPENLGKYELVVNGGLFRRSIAMILTGDVYASHLDHLPMRINDAFFMRTTDPTDQCRLAVGGKPKWGYFTTWDYQFHNDIPGATFEEAWNMEWDLVPHLISENGAVFSDVHDGSCYVRGNINQVVEDGGPIMVLQNEMIGVQGSIVRVLSNAFGVKEVLLDGEPIACGERVFNAPQVDTTAENEHKVTFVMCPISPALRSVGYSYPYGAGYESSYVRMVVEDIKGQHTYHYEFSDNEDKPFSLSYPINESDVDTLTSIELQYTLMLTANGERKPVMHGYKGTKVAQWVDRSQAIEDVYLDISQPLVQGDYTSGVITADDSAPYTVEDTAGYWEHEDIWDLNGNSPVPATPGDEYYRSFRVRIGEGYDKYKFDKNNPPKIKIRGLNRECDNIVVKVASDEKSVWVSLTAHPSELLQNAWGTVVGLRAGSPVGGVSIKPKDSYYDFNITEIQRIENGTVYSTSPSDLIDPAYTYRVNVVGVGKKNMTFRNGPWQYDITFGYYLNTNVRMRMNNDFDTAADYKEVSYDTSSQAYSIDLTPEPDVTCYEYLSLGAPYPWAGTCPEYSNYMITGVPGGITVRNYSWFDVENGARMEKDTPFVSGRSYRFEVILDCEEGYYLADSDALDAFVNGKKAQVSEAADNGVAITIEYSDTVSSGLRGQVVSFADDSNVTVSLFAEGSTEPQYTTIVPAGEESGGKYTAVYEIPDVSSGSYTVKVSKKDHVTGEYEVTLGAEAVEQNAEIYPVGDVNQDGKVNMTDIVLLIRYQAGWSVSIYEKAADMNADSKISMADLVLMIRKVMK